MIIVENETISENKADWPTLIKAGLSGDRVSLDALLKNIQPLVFNLAQKMLLNPDDAADLTQEILLKVLLGLQTFNAEKAAFTTWVYTIARNQILKFKQGRLEAITESFDAYGEAIYQIVDEVMTQQEMQNPEMQLLVKEANVGCMLGMLLCLTREERLIFVLGEILGVTSDVGGSIMNITAENFRQRLARARRDLYAFMQNKCGLVNKNNPCRCHRKTKGFIKAGYVNPQKIQFAHAHYQNLQIFSEKTADTMCDLETEYGAMFRNLPAYDVLNPILSVTQLIESAAFRETFKLSPDSSI